MNDIQNRIVEIVNSSQGLKGTELAVKLATEFLSIQSESIIHWIDSCVEEGLIQEIEYVLPNMDYRIKSFYLPMGTSIIVKGE